MKKTRSLADGDISSRAVAIGRLIDRLCRTPGEYQVKITVPVHGRSPWIVSFERVETLRRMALRRQKRCSQE